VVEAARIHLSFGGDGGDQQDIADAPVSRSSSASARAGPQFPEPAGAADVAGVRIGQRGPGGAELVDRVRHR